jgi:cytidine deaminase
MMNETPTPTVLTSAQQEALLTAAREAAEQAYAPYSNFHVGAALLDDRGRIFSGCNVENLSYGLTICAERNAIGAAVRAGARKIVATLVYTPTPLPTPPCGACRQVLAEFGPEMEIHMHCTGPTVARYTMRQLLPAAFDDLQRD